MITCLVFKKLVRERPCPSYRIKISVDILMHFRTQSRVKNVNFVKELKKFVQSFRLLKIIREQVIIDNWSLQIFSQDYDLMLGTLI